MDANFNFIRYPIIAVVLQIQLKWIPNSMNVNENITLAQGKKLIRNIVITVKIIKSI